MTEEVTYKDIPRNPAYHAGSDGSIWSRQMRYADESPVWRRLKPRRIGSKVHRPRAGRYLSVALFDEQGRRSNHMVHRLILEAFVGPCPEGMEACHNDGDPENNRPENLRWDTRAENCRDKIRHGTTPSQAGEANPSAKLTTDDVREIHRMLAAGRTRASCAARFGVSGSAINAAANGKTWKQVMAEWRAGAERPDA